MAGTYGKDDYAPTSGAVDFERLYVRGVEIDPSALGGNQMNAVTPVNLKDEVTPQAVAKVVNNLITELKLAGLMANK